MQSNLALLILIMNLCWVVVNNDFVISLLAKPARNCMDNLTLLGKAFFTVINKCILKLFKGWDKKYSSSKGQKQHLLISVESYFFWNIGRLYLATINIYMGADGCICRDRIISAIYWWRNNKGIPISGRSWINSNWFNTALSRKKWALTFILDAVEGTE